jgi:glycosyltransferase involved in cell wall biosynthesis
MPLVSFALPVRNGRGTIAQAIESICSQTLKDWELVISDNCSSDGTSEICASFAADDRRVRHLPTGRPLSQNKNFTAAFRHARGTFFRWCGDDDWLEPSYAERTIHALSGDSSAVLCTTLQRCYRDDQPTVLNDALNYFQGVDAHDPIGRVVQFLRILEGAGRLGIDPIYSLMRRDALSRTGLVIPNRFGDFILACEMAILGPFRHVPVVLAHRRLPKPSPSTSQLEQLTNRRSWTRFIQREISLVEVMRAADRHGVQRRFRLAGTLLGFGVREHGHGIARRLRLVTDHSEH